MKNANESGTSAEVIGAARAEITTGKAVLGNAAVDR